MGRIQAILVDPKAPARLAVSEAEGPSPAPSEALVRVAAISLNRGEVNRSQAAEGVSTPAGTSPARSRRPPMTAPALPKGRGSSA